MYSIETLKGKGRSLVSSNKINKGTSILIEKLTIGILDEKHLTTHCSGCFQKNQVKKCSNCQCLSYCSKACQRKDWSFHKSECQGFAKIKPNIPTSYMRVVGRMLIIKDEFDKNCLVSLSSFQSKKSIQDFEFLARGMLMYLPLNSISIDRLVEYFCIAQSNLFGLTDSQCDYVGYALGYKACLINHSCLPNSYLSFVNDMVHVHAFKDIPKGEEITISYLESIQTRELRKVALSHFYFDCKCNHCILPMDPQCLFNCFNCEYYKIEFDPFTNLSNNPIVCPECKVDCYPYLKELYIETQSSILSIPETDITSSILSVYESTCIKLLKFSNINNSLYGAYLHTLFTKLRMNTDPHPHQTIIDLVLRYARHLESVYGFNHPQLVSVYTGLSAMVHDTESMMSIGKEFIPKWVQVLEITHGKHHPLYSDALIHYNGFVIALNEVELNR